MCKIIPLAVSKVIVSTVLVMLVSGPASAYSCKTEFQTAQALIQEARGAGKI